MGENTGKQRSGVSSTEDVMDDDTMKYERCNQKLAELYARIDQVRDDIRDLHRRSEKSVSALLELRDEREVLEARLEALLVQVGAIAYDAGHLGDSATPPDSRSAQDPEGEFIDTDAREMESPPQDLQPSSEVVDEVPPADAPIVQDAGDKEAEADEPVEPPENASASDTHQLRRSTHDIYLTTARIFPGIKSELGSPPKKIDSFADVMGEMGMLHRAAQPEQLEKWAQLPDEIQRTLASYVAARLRHLQDGIDASLSGLVADDDRVLEIFSRLKRHMETYWPGYAHGLARDHEPENGTWAEDATQYKELLDGYAEKYYGEGVDTDGDDEKNPEVALNEIESFIEKHPKPEKLRAFVSKRLGGGLRADDPRLVKMLKPFQGMFEGNEFRRLRAAFGVDEDEQPNDDDSALVPEDWPWREKLRRSRVVMIGGDARPDAQARLEDAFQPVSFEWPSIEYNKSMRLVQSWANRIRQGSVDIVILLTEFMSHKVSGAIVEAAKDSPGVELVYIDRGYGVTQVQRGIENFVDLDEVVEFGG